MRDRWGQTKKQAGGKRENETYWKKKLTDIMKMHILILTIKKCRMFLKDGNFILRFSLNISSKLIFSKVYAKQNTAHILSAAAKQIRSVCI